MGWGLTHLLSYLGLLDSTAWLLPSKKQYLMKKTLQFRSEKQIRCCDEWQKKTGWWKQISSNSKVTKTRGNMRERSLTGHRESKTNLTLSGKVAGCWPCLLPWWFFISICNIHHQVLDILTSVHSDVVPSKSFHCEKRDRYCMMSEQWHICTFLLPLCNHANCFHIRLLVSFPAQKNFSAILISKCSQTGVRFGFLKLWCYDFIVQ